MELAAYLWALGDVPLAMAGSGAVVLGPQPWLLLPVGPLQLFLGAGEPRVGGRIHVLRGPWLRIALVRSEGALSLAWEVLASPFLSLIGTLGNETGCGLRLRRAHLWAAALIRQGGLSLWCGLYFSL